MVLWVFGYGSLIWRTGFSYDERIIGYIQGYKRAFHQACTEHRGTEANPGRTLTLVESNSITWGAAYRITGHEEEQRVLAYLNQRERQYDVRAYIPFFTVESGDAPALTNVLVYIATADETKNCSYLGPASLEVTASQIAIASGPAGPNYEYLFRLEESLFELSICTGKRCVDEELIQLGNAVRKVLAGMMKGNVLLASSRSKAIGMINRNSSFRKAIKAIQFLHFLARTSNNQSVSVAVAAITIQHFPAGIS